MPKFIPLKALKKRRLSKRELAKRMGKPYQTVFRYFRDDYNPTLKTMIAIAKGMSCKVRDLIEE